MIDLGDIVQVAVAIRDSSGTMANPTTATLTITLPDGTTTAPTVPLPPAETGILRVDFETVQVGLHSWRLTTTGPVTARSDVFDVRAATPAILFSLSDAKEHLNIPADRTTDDEELRRFVEAVTEIVESGPDWGVGPVAVRTYVDRIHPHATPALVLRHRPVLSVTSVTAVLDGGTTYLPADLDVDGQAGIVVRRAAAGLWFTGGPWDAVYLAGRRQVPANISHAGRIILQHLWSTQRSRDIRRPPIGTSGETLEVRAAGMTFSVPRRAIELLGSHAQAGGFA
jgi:hypothetical protein